MARPTTKPRVPVLDPEREVLRFVRAVHAHWQKMRAVLHPDEARAAPSDTQLQRSPLYRDLVQVARYAVRGAGGARAPVSLLLAQLAPLLQVPLLPPCDLSRVLAAINPDDEADPMKLLLAAAVARAALDEGSSAITSSQLALLAGVTRRHVGAEIREGRLDTEIAGRRGTAGAALIRPEEARRWLRERGAGAE